MKIKRNISTANRKKCQKFIFANIMNKLLFVKRGKYVSLHVWTKYILRIRLLIKLQFMWKQEHSVYFISYLLLHICQKRIFPRFLFNMNMTFLQEIFKNIEKEAICMIDKIIFVVSQLYLHWMCKIVNDFPNVKS